MNWEVVRREWGAVTFVLTVIVGMVVVPLALYFTNQGPAPVAVPNITIASPSSAASSASAAR